MKKMATMMGMFVCVWFVGMVDVEGSWLDKVNIFKKTEEKAVTLPDQGVGADEIAAAFKEALRMGTSHVVDRLGGVDGFNKDPAIHIPLPAALNTVKVAVDKIGMGHMVDALELKLNRAAEAATPKAKSLFIQAITEMSFDDVRAIYEGPDNSATLYFQEKMSPLLKEEMQPIVSQTLSEVGAIQAYDTVMAQYKTVPFVPDVTANLTDYVLVKGVEGIFYYIAQEEAAIRKNPVKQTTDLLKKVFGVNPAGGGV